MLNLKAKLVEGKVLPNKALAQYLDLKGGPTDTLVYAAVEKAYPTYEALYKVIQVVHNMLNHGNYKVGQLVASGEFLVKCQSPTDADRLHEAPERGKSPKNVRRKGSSKDEK
uniref:Uncharacterized protein n=1 Tax=Setaria viridis TaxID=4556 RepID=A0A4U6SXE6_SETVI|nr:hypothetical protein SEVIR_9G239900v2 [Setaria viridis]